MRGAKLRYDAVRPFEENAMTLTVPDPRRPRLLRQFADLCRSSAPADQARRVREARALIRAGQSPAMIEVMIAASAFESAALTLIGNEAAWLISKSAEGSCLASVVLPGMSEEATCEGATPALALLGAWAVGALALCGQSHVNPARPLRPEGALLN